MNRSVVVSGKSQSTYTNYARCLAHMGLHFKISLLELDDEQILDYLHYLKQQHKTPSESLTLSQEEFIRRFSLHILPKGFTKIRHYGILSSSSKTKFRKLIDQELGKVTFQRNKKEVSKHRLCPKCRKGHLITLSTFEQRGPPINWEVQFSS